MMSRCPSVVSMPTVAPFRSRSALVATVVPCTTRSVAPSSAAVSVPSSRASSTIPSITPMDGSSGVEADLAIATRPSGSTATRSVKVPPTSMPMRYMSAASARATARAVAVLAGDEAVLEIGGARGGVAPRRLAPAATARGHDVEEGAGRHGNADLLGLEHPPLALGHHHVAVGQAVAAPKDAVSRVAHAVARGVAFGELRGLHAQPEHGADAAAELAVALGVGRSE